MFNQRKATVLLGTVLLIASGAYGQSYVESAGIFGRTRPGGSARIQAMGGSQTALGGDYSSAFSNPAGLGMFNRSEVTFTPAFSTYKASSNYLGDADEASKSRLTVPGISAVFNMPIDKSGFVSGSFAISMNRTNDFNGSISYHGVNSQSSIIDSFLDNAFGSTTDQFDPDTGPQYNTPTGLAYFNYLIGPQSIQDPDLPDDEYFSDVEVDSHPLQQENVQTKGATNQWNFAYGANYKDMVYMGLGIGVSSLRYKSEKVYSESFDDDPFLRDMQLSENLNIKGNGINATLGAIVRPIDFFQVGLSFTTPTYYEFTETYEASMSTDWKNFDYYGDGSEILNNESASTDIVTSDYALTTPLKVSTGIAFLSKFGILTGDVEFTNPAKAKYSSNTTGISYTDENNGIKSTYKSVINYRVGAEFRHKILRARAGYAVQGNTFKDGIGIDNSITSISGGVGLRFEKFYTDFALIHSSGKGYYSPYSFYDGSGPTVDLDNKTITGMVTFGFMF